jgi:RHS repeat-associated protein
MAICEKSLTQCVVKLPPFHGHLAAVLVLTLLGLGNSQAQDDALGRPSATATVLDNPTVPAVVSVAYDASTGRMASKTWPTGYQASYVYSATGYLRQVNGGGTGGFTQTVSYEVLAMDAQGHITQYKQGNQVSTVKAYNEATGRLSGQTATKDGQATGNVLNQSYTYDSLGNLTTRVDNSPGVGIRESFSYDSLNRLSLATLLGGAVSPPSTTEVKYDARGNITYKSDVGRYWYDAARPNRMTNITLETAPGAQVALTGTRQLVYAFDDYKPGAQTVNGTALGNGNLEYTVSRDTNYSRHTWRGETYTSFNMPMTISFGSLLGTTPGSAAEPVERKLAFVYGPEHQRIKQTVTGGRTPGTTWYLNGEDSLGLSYEKEQLANGTTENKHYLSVGGVVFALFVSRTGTLNGWQPTSTRYFHLDHLGSVVAFSDEAGTVIERLAFDPWGKRRFVNGNLDAVDSMFSRNTDRGYTMHEHLDEVGVIHMNGRVYDPLVGRFMSADPTIPNPFNLQSFNRYSYVRNNPLRLFDPTGFDESDGSDSDSGSDTGNSTPSGAPDDSGRSLADVTVTDSRETDNHPGWGGSVVSTTFSDGVVMHTRPDTSVSPNTIVGGKVLGWGVASPSPSIASYASGGMNAMSDFLTFGYSGQVRQAFRDGDYVSVGLATIAGASFGIVSVGTGGTSSVSNGLGRGSAAVAASSAREIAKAEVFATRTAPELKGIYGWGNGIEGVQQARAALNVSIATRIEASVSRAEIEATRNLYNEAAAVGRGGLVAPERAQLMQDILDLLK